mmetsp:Transcript_66199/g.123590  ORF Transcript_66199/g.123590 Transcript_66199/m.123590 type:complete len:247 (-) Transcript_66199:92-832(-)
MAAMDDLHRLCMPPTVVAPKVPWSALHLPMPNQSSPSSMAGRYAYLQDNVLQNWSQMNGHRSCLEEVVVLKRTQGEKAVADQKAHLQELMRSGKHRSLDPVGHGPGFVTLKQRYNALLSKAQYQEIVLDQHRGEIRARQGYSIEGNVVDEEMFDAVACKSRSTDVPRIVPSVDLADPNITRRQKLFGDGMPSSAREAARRSFQPVSCGSAATSTSFKQRSCAPAPPGVAMEIGRADCRQKESYEPA